MSDDRFQRDDEANANDPRAPYIDRKPYRPSSGTPTKFNLAAEVEKFLREVFGAEPKQPKERRK